VDTSAGVPGGGSPLLNTFSLYGNDVSLMGFSGVSSGFGLYTTRGGTFHKVPGTDALTTFSIAPTSMDAQRILFHKEYPRTVGQTTVMEAGFAVVNPDQTISVGTAPTSGFKAREGNSAFVGLRRFAGNNANPYLNSSAGTFDFSTGGGIFGPLPPSFHLPGEPDSTFTFLLGPFSDDGRSTVFAASSSPDSDINHRTQWGIYGKSPNAPLRTVANNSTVVPGGNGVATFENFGSVTIDGPNVAFIGGSASGNLGIFAESGGRLMEVISAGDQLDGKTVSALSFSNDRPLSGNDLVFTAEFTDGSKGLFLTTVPEPAWPGGVAAAFLFARRRR
jgi:hypothetical protein